MPACTGREILAKLCHHLGISQELDAVAANTKVRLALMPCITAQFMPRAAGDQPHVLALPPEKRRDAAQARRSRAVFAAGQGQPGAAGGLGLAGMALRTRYAWYALPAREG
jgi:hypothetical protein